MYAFCAIEARWRESPTVASLTHFLDLIQEAPGEFTDRMPISHVLRYESITRVASINIDGVVKYLGAGTTTCYFRKKSTNRDASNYSSKEQEICLGG